MSPSRAGTWRHVLGEARRQLGSEIDARRIVERASGYDGTELVVRMDELAPERAVELVDSMVDRRRAGEPLQYVVGIWGFRTLDLLVDRRVLIPRPETELVVEVALRELAAFDSRDPVLVADLGTGSGAIALSVAQEAPPARVWATDSSAEALAVARANLAGMGSSVATRVRIAEGSWFDALPDELHGRLDMVVSNPPYVGAGEELPPEVAGWEPVEALVAGPSGTEAIEEILRSAPDWLSPSGVAVLEIAPHQADQALVLAGDAGLVDAVVRPDLTGRDRVLVARRGGGEASGAVPGC
ncbi:MAG: peptide chain release factor N(5)-glutamine methyltransferase [Acidimicrobiales bacterium]